MRVSDPCGGGGGGGGGSGGRDKEDMFEDPGSWPPGFRFHPTDEELILYYLKRKICRRRLKLNVIADIDVYKCVPEDLPGLSILKSGDRQWFFFTPRDRKYPNGARSNRATRHGYWKATGKDRNIMWNSRSVGVKKTLVFYKGRAPSGERTDWVMHEYTMEEEELQRCKEVKDCYALCKVFKKSGPGPKNGEQYGAPFREEDWVDDCESVENNKPNEDNRVLENGSATLDDFRVLQNGSASVDQFRMLQDTSASVDNFRVLQNVNTSAADNVQVLQNTNASADNLRVLQNGNNSADNLWVLQNNNTSVDNLRVLQNVNPSVDNLLVLQNGNAFVKNDSVNKCQPPLDDLDEFFREIDNVPVLNQPADNGYAYMLSQFGFESTMMRASPGEVISADLISCYPTRNQWNVQNSLNATQSALSRLPSYEAPEVTSSLNVLDQDPLNIDDVGYLEMNDLLSTPVRSSNVTDTCQSSQVEPMDSLGGPDLFFDASMLLQDIGTINQGAVVDPNSNNIGDVLSSRVNYQPPIEFNLGDDISQIWVHDRRADIFASSEPNQVVMASPTSAAVALIHDSISTNPQCEGRENQDGNEDGDVDSWFSSAISAFLGSVPARPALASENVLNRAFERMSSFSRMTIAAKDTAVPTIVEPIVRRRMGRHGGFLFFSVLGVVCAILWMLMIGTAVKVVKAFIGKFISSL